MVRGNSTARLALTLLLSIVFSHIPQASAQTRPTTAAELAARAKARFDQGDFREAASLLRQAYTLGPTSALLYNMGRAYQQAGEKGSAIAAYEEYLGRAGHPQDEGAVRATIAQLRTELQHDEELKDQIDRERRAAEEAAQLEVRRQNEILSQRSHLPFPSVIPWTVAGVGGAGLVAGGILGVLALTRHSSAQGASDVATAQSRQNEATTLATGSNAAFIGGGALVLAGVVLWGLLDVRASTHSPPRSGALNAALTGGPGALCVDF